METFKFSKHILYLFAFLLVVFTSCKTDDGEEPKPDQDPDPAENTLTANAGADSTVEAGTLFKLNGTASKDSKNEPFTYSWTILTKPAGSTATLTNANNVQPTFTPDEVGDYEIELTIANQKHSHKDRVKVTAIAATPLSIDNDITVKTVLEDRIANPNLPDYVVTKNVNVDAELTIKPGVVIAFNRDVTFSIENNSVIIASGTADKKIKFVGREAVAGFWKGMVLYSTSNANVFDHVVFSHAGSNTILSGKKAALTLFGGSKAQVSVKNSLFTDNEGYGIHVAFGSTLRQFSKNTFTKNTDAGIVLSSEMVSSLDYESKFVGENGRDVVEVMGSYLTDPNNDEVVWEGFEDKAAYLFTGNVTVSTGWKLQPGVTIKMGRDIKLDVDGDAYIKAEGTPENKIVITGANQTPGYWRGIMIYSTLTDNVFKHVEVSYGGSNILVSGKKANIGLYGKAAYIKITDSVIKGCPGYGVFVSYTSIVEDDIETTNTFTENTLGAIFDENK